MNVELITTRSGYPATTEMLSVSPDQARRWLSQNNYSKQRPIRGWHVKNLANEMRCGRFMPGTQIHFASLNGHWHLVNGQHTLSAIDVSGVPQVLSVMVTAVESMEAVASLYFRHDTQLTRPLADAFNATGLADEWGVTPTTLQVIAAASIYLWTCTKKEGRRKLSNLTNDVKLEIVQEYREPGLFAARVFEGGLNKIYLRRRSTFASVMFCFEHPATEGFWRQIVADDGLRQGSPQKTLLDYLRDTITPGGAANSVSRKRTVGEHMMVKGIAHAWNAYMSRRELKIIRPDFDSKVANFAEVGEMRVG